MDTTSELVTHVFHDRELEFHGLMLDVMVEVTADVSEPYSDNGRRCRGDVDRCGYTPKITFLEAWHENGKLPDIVRDMLSELREEEIAEAVLAKIGDMDIDDALLRACGQ